MDICFTEHVTDINSMSAISSPMLSPMFMFIVILHLEIIYTMLKKGFLLIAF